MLPIVGQAVVNIPFDILKPFFQQPALWPSWNHFVSNTGTQQFELCKAFHSDFLDFAPPYKRDYEPAGHQTIVKLEDTPGLFQVAWKYHIVDNEGETAIFGQHSTSVYRFNGSDDRSAFYTWEKMTGYEPRYSPEHFSKILGAVKNKSMDGIGCLESVYASSGGLDPAAVELACGQGAPTPSPSPSPAPAPTGGDDHPSFALDLLLVSTSSSFALRPRSTTASFADVAGIVHWLHTGGVVESLKEPDDEIWARKPLVIQSYKFRVRNPQAALEETRHSLLSDFGPYVPYGFDPMRSAHDHLVSFIIDPGSPIELDYPEAADGAGQSFAPGLDAMQAKIGEFVGVRRQTDRRFPLPGDMPAFRFSIPVRCPNLPASQKGTHDAPNAACLKYEEGGFMQGGLCGNIADGRDPDGSRGCTYSISPDVQGLWLDEVTGLSDLNCHRDGAWLDNKCVYRNTFRDHCVDDKYRRRFNRDTGEIETNLTYCVEYDIHPDCLKGCDLPNCTARLARGEEIEVGIPFWLGRCDADANRRRVERLFAAFRDEEVIHHGLQLAASKKLLVNDYVADQVAPCHRAESPKVCRPHGSSGGPYCFRGFSGVCQPCYVPNASQAFRHPACPLAALKSPEYSDPESGLSPLRCPSKKVKDLCCLYNLSDPAVRCDGDSNPEKASFSDEGLMLVAARQNTTALAAFFERYARVELKKSIDSTDAFEAWAAEQWHATPRHVSFDAAVQDLRQSCAGCLADLPEPDPLGGLPAWAQALIIIAIVLVVILFLVCIWCYIRHDKSKTDAAEINQSLQPVADPRESSLQPRG